MLKLENPQINQAQRRIDLARPIESWTLNYDENDTVTVNFYDGTTATYTYHQFQVWRAVKEINTILNRLDVPQIRAVKNSKEVIDHLNGLFIGIIQDMNIAYNLGLRYENIRADVRSSTFRTTIKSMAENFPVHYFFRKLNNEGDLLFFDYIEIVTDLEIGQE